MHFQYRKLPLDIEEVVLEETPAVEEVKSEDSNPVAEEAVAEELKEENTEEVPAVEEAKEENAEEDEQKGE